MDAGSNADTRTILIHDGPTQEIVLDIDDRTARAAERAAKRLEADFTKVETKIHRFPRGLRGIGGDGGGYISPSVVAIGPYHHGAPHLQNMEEVKLAASYNFCRSSEHSTVKVYERVRSVVGAARGFYDADDPSVVGLGDGEFAAMMFLDGCFLLQYMLDDDNVPVLQNRMTLSTGPSIQKDIFLVENQIPWLVLEALMEFMPVDVRRFVDDMGAKFLPGTANPKNGQRRMKCGCIPVQAPLTGERHDVAGSTQHYQPPHLLGLLRFTQVGAMPEDMVNYTGFPRSSLSSSAVELAQIGVVLTPSTEPWFGDMRVRRRHLGGELLLSPVFLGDVTACWLVNLAALEASTAGANKDSDGFVVSSYLSVLAMLMDSNDDVQKLRVKHVLYSTFSNKQVLGFFKRLAQHLRFGGRYYATLEEIESYKRHRCVRIAIHKLLYNSFKAMTIATLFSIVGVLVGIFKTLLDNKKH